LNPIWLRTAAWLGAALVPAGVLWLLAGPVAALALLLAVALGLLVHHLVNVGRLDAWVHALPDTPVPDSRGLWAHLYSALHRRRRLANADRQQLMQALERQRAATQAMPDGVVILRDANLIEWINGVAEQQLGVDAQRDTGMPLANLVRHPEFVELLERGESSVPLLMPAPAPAGHMLSVQLIPFGDDHRLLLSRDVTHVERLETMRRDFVANVSHEMRTPLTVIHGYLEMLADDPASIGSDEGQRFIAAAQEQSARLQRLVADLLTLSSLETGSPVPAEERIEVPALLNTVAREAMTLSCGQHKIVVDAGPAATIVGCERELHSALGNLASNAVRYTPAGGRIRLFWQMDEGQGLLGVQDDGIGIEARHVPRLTERFYRVDRSRSRESGGTGLGLAIVKHVLERHQARLDVDSMPGEGSTFTMRLPARRVMRAETPLQTTV